MVNRLGLRSFLVLGAISVATFLCGYALAAENSYIARAFKEAAFNPHAFLETQIVAHYGAGDVRENKNFVEHRYLDPSSGLGAIVSIDADPAPQYRIASEIMLIAKDVGIPSANLEGLGKIALFGVKVGDGQAAAQAVAQRKYGAKSIRTKLLGEPVTQLMFFSSEEETNTFYKYYFKDGHVVAMSIGLTD